MIKQMLAKIKQFAKQRLKLNKNKVGITISLLLVITSVFMSTNPKKESISLSAMSLENNACFKDFSAQKSQTCFKKLETAGFLLGEYSTNVSANKERNKNIELAVSLINGAEVKPGEVFSFNKAVGDTNLPSRGFKKSTVIVNGEPSTAYGGGVCQVSTTLYVSAIKSGLNILERYNHQLKPIYVPEGLDATISYGSLDLKFKNPHDFSIFVYCSLAKNNLSFKIIGKQKHHFDEIRVVTWHDELAPEKIFGDIIYIKAGQEVATKPLWPSSYKKIEIPIFQAEDPLCEKIEDTMDKPNR